jgi:hypothetical protein
MKIRKGYEYQNDKEEIFKLPLWFPSHLLQAYTGDWMRISFHPDGTKLTLLKGYCWDETTHWMPIPELPNTLRGKRQMKIIALTLAVLCSGCAIWDRDLTQAEADKFNLQAEQFEECNTSRRKPEVERCFYEVYGN